MRNNEMAVSYVRALARGRVHAGYGWAAVCSDGELLCETCVRSNYRLVLRATLKPCAASYEWQIVGLTNSGESETSAHCAHCHKIIWETA